MSPFSVASYRDASDIAQIVAFVRAVRPASLLSEYPSLYELPELLARPFNRETLRLWRDEHGLLAGWAYIDAFHTLRFDIDWRAPDAALEGEIFRWGEACVRGTAPTLLSTSHDADAARLACFDRHGFAELPGWIVHMSCTLDRRFPAASIPDGFTIRPVAGIAEAAAVAELHRAAFGTAYMTTEHRLRMMASPRYDPQLDLVAVAADGALAAYALGEGSAAAPHLCYADMYATHPAYRGCGLARALMLLLLERLQARGYATALLGTDNDNLAMQHVASTAGFRISGRTLRFEREVEALPNGCGDTE